MNSDRYHRQSLLPMIGPAGQERLAASRVFLIGCGALGTHIAEHLVRAGVGRLRIADRDVVEWTNLQRQVLFDEDDARSGAPKAAAAATRLLQINSSVQVEPVVVDIHSGNITALAGLEIAGDAVDLILDGADNVETRYLINDVAVRHQIPWIYGACVGVGGRVMAIEPGRGACLRCVFPDPPSAADLPTCDTAGVLGMAAAIVAAQQAAIAIRLLVGRGAERQLLTVDAWKGRFHAVELADARRTDCRCCGQHQYDFLNARPARLVASLCGRNAVQIAAPVDGAVDELSHVAAGLERFGDVQRSAFLVRCRLREPQEMTLTIFADGRVIVQGTSDAGRARSVAARFLGGWRDNAAGPQ